MLNLIIHVKYMNLSNLYASHRIGSFQYSGLPPLSITATNLKPSGIYNRAYAYMRGFLAHHVPVTQYMCEDHVSSA